MKNNVARMPKLRFSEFSKPWEPTKIGNNFLFKNGLNKEKEFFGKGTPIINFKDVYKAKGLSRDDVQGLVELSREEIENFSAKKGDIFFTRTSETINDIGMTSVLLEDIPGCVFSGFVLRARPIDNILLDVFKAYIFSTNSVRKEIITKSSYTTRALTSGTLLSDVEYCYPSDKNEQQRIADFLFAVDEKIQQLTKKKNLLEKYKKSVMQKIFSQKIRFKDDNGNDYPDWEDKELSEFLEPKLREIDKPQGAYLAIGIRSHCKGTFQKPNSDPNKIEMDKLYIVRENDLIVNITFAWEGAIALVKKEDDGGLVSHRFPTYVFNRGSVLYEFFRYVIIQKRFRSLLDLISPGGAGRNRVLSKKDFLKLKVFIPKVDEQQKIADFLNNIDTKIEYLNQQIEKAQAFKKVLLQQIFV